MRAGVAGALLAGVAAALIAASPPFAAEPGFVPIEVRAHPIRDFRLGAPGDRFGALEFRGGLALASVHPDFGAWSGLDIAADGKTLYAVSDRGAWLTTRLVEEDGRLTGIDGAMIAPILDDDGRPLVGKENGDAEGLRIVERDGRAQALVSFEQEADVRVFAAAPDFARAAPRHLSLPAFVGRLRHNQGLEAIAVAPADGRLSGATVAIAEHTLDRNGNHRGFILDGPLAGAFSLRRLGDFDVTDAAFLANGDLIVLERRFGFPGGIAMRLRLIEGATIAPGVTVDGPTLIEAGTGYAIDNMEGLAVRAGETGETLIDLISDDNGNPLQRTVLLQFALKPVTPPLPRLRPAAAPLR